MIRPSLVVAALALGGCPGSEAPAPPAEPAAPEARPPLPNVVLVTLDTTRADRIGSYGYEGAGTDVLDGLAARGLRFERAYSVLPLTIPSHASIFTGLYPPHHGIRSNGDAALDASRTTLAEVLSEHGYVTGASVAAFVTTQVWGFSQGFDVYMDQGIRARGNFWHGARPAEEVVDDALRWVASEEGDEPLFLWVHLYDAHLPWRAPERYAETFAGRPYDAEIAYVDDQVGRLVEAFAEEPTLFVVVGDHGEGLGEHGEATHGLYTYDATQRVPFFLAGPGISPGVVEEPVSIVDVAPTILDVLGLPPLPDVDGQAVPGPARPVYMESWQLAERFGLAPHRTIVEGTDKLVATPIPELYDLAADPAERTNTAADRPERVAELLAILDGMDLPAPSGREGVLDPEVAMQLQQLGYVASTFSGELSEDLPDPKEHARLLNGIGRLHGHTARGEWPEAEALLRELIAAYPDVVELHHRLYRVLRVQRKDAEARRAIEVAAARFPDSHTFKSARATVLLNEGRYREAASLYREVAEAMPWHPAMRTRAVFALFRAEDGRDEALALGLSYLEAHPDDPGVAGLVGLDLIRRREPARARPYLEAASEAPRPFRGVCLHLGVMAQLDGDLDTAREYLERELRHYPDNDAALRALQVLLDRQRDWAGLVDVAERMILLNPDAAYPRFVKAQALFNLEDYAAARETLDEVLALRPAWSRALLLDANLLVKEGKEEAGRARFEEAKAARADEEAKAARGPEGEAPPSEGPPTGE